MLRDSATNFSSQSGRCPLLTKVGNYVTSYRLFDVSRRAVTDGVVILPPRYPVIKLFMLDFLFRVFRMRAGPSLFVDNCNCANLLSLRQTIRCITVIH